MDTIQIIKINEDQLLVDIYLTTINSRETIKLDLKFDNLKNIIRKIKHNILDNYVISGSTNNKLNDLKNTSYELFNILNFFDFKDLFIQLKKNKFNHIQLIVDEYTNQIPFELLHDGKDFLSDYIILSRLFVDSVNNSKNDFIIESDKIFSIVSNPSESDDIMVETDDESNHIASLINPFFDLRGPYKKRYVNKVELIHLLGISSFFHFSGHYKNDTKKNGWELFNDLFTSLDIQKILKSPTFIFSNTCGGSSDFFINSFLNKGSQSIIASFGNLPSKKASEFSKIFYKYFINDNLNLGESFFLSKRDMINHYGKEDLFWCFYQIYGSSFLIINKKKIKRNKKQLKPLKFLSFSLLLLFSIFVIFNYFKNQNYIEEEPKFILEKLIIMKDNRFLDNHVNIDSSKNTININGKDSIYFQLIDKKPIFSSNKYFKGLDIFMHSKTNIQTLFNYKNDTLDLFLENKNSCTNDEYHKIYLHLGEQYKNIKVYIKYIDNDINDYDLYLFDKNNYKRYKVSLSNLIKESKKYPSTILRNNQTYGTIDQNAFNQISDPKTLWNEPLDRFDLIKENMQFNEELYLHIKKALIK